MRSSPAEAAPRQRFAPPAAARVELHRPEDALPAWDVLWRSMPDPQVFTSPAWLSAWAQVYAPDRCVIASLAMPGGWLACLPVFSWQGTLRLAGTGPSDWGDALCRPGLEAAMPPLLQAVLEHLGPRVQRVSFEQLPAHSSLLGLEAPAGWLATTRAGVPCPVLSLSGEDGLGGVPERQRANWRYACRRLHRAGGRIEQLPAAGVAGGLRELARLHGLRWRSRGEGGVLADPLLERLLHSAARDLAMADLLRLHRIVLGERTIAILLVLRAPGCSSYFLSGFDPAHAALSPGVVLVGAAIAQAARDGDEVFDFLRGQEPYKYAWGARDRPSLALSLARS